MNLQTFDINEFNNRIVPLTYFRRNAGEVFDKLSSLGQLIIIKDGQPIARLSSIPSSLDWRNLEAKINISRSFVGKKGNLSALIAQDRQDH